MGGGGLCLVHESVHSLVIIDLESEGVLREGSPDETSAPGEIPAFSSLRLGKERGDVFASSEVSERIWCIAILSCFPTSLQVTFCTAAKFTWLVLGGDLAARSCRVEQIPVL